jgi:hypothetical protein
VVSTVHTTQARSKKAARPWMIRTTRRVPVQTTKRKPQLSSDRQLGVRVRVRVHVHVHVRVRLRVRVRVRVRVRARVNAASLHRRSAPV